MEVVHTQLHGAGQSRQSCQPNLFVVVGLNIDKGQLSRAIKQLVKKDILVSRGSDIDARLVEISTTPKGRKLHDSMLNYSAERNEIIVQDLMKSECNELFRLLEKITRSSKNLINTSG